MKRLTTFLTGAGILYLFLAPATYKTQPRHLASFSSPGINAKTQFIADLAHTETSTGSVDESEFYDFAWEELCEEPDDNYAFAGTNLIERTGRSTPQPAKKEMAANWEGAEKITQLSKEPVTETMETVRPRINIPAMIETSAMPKPAEEIVSAPAVAETAVAATPVEEKQLPEVSQASYATGSSNKFSNPANIKTETGADGISYFTLYEKAEQVKSFAVKNGFNSRYAFLVDMGIKSSRKRFFIVDLATYEVINRGMVTHGKGNEDFATDKKYSNEAGSNCTSLGVYKVGKAFNGEFGQAFKLYGLSKTNNLAYERFIVLHSMNLVPDAETTSPIVQTEGCPSVSPKFLNDMKPLIEKTAKPILLWIFDSGADGAGKNLERFIKTENILPRTNGVVKLDAATNYGLTDEL